MRESYSRAGLQNYCPWCCPLRNGHWARFITVGFSSQLLSCLDLFCAISAQTPHCLRKKPCRQSHWAGCEKPGSWLIPDLVGLRPALAKKRKSKFFFLSPVLCTLTTAYSIFLILYLYLLPWNLPSTLTPSLLTSGMAQALWVFWHFLFSECQTVSPKRSCHISNLAVFCCLYLLWQDVL